ncbi:MAG TPA: Ig-like domain-containing protein [Terriglobales bacterium]|jgi:hypothetical protein|nr:Ig-like domain-containing protein [Terriglobales bacterium]
MQGIALVLAVAMSAQNAQSGAGTAMFVPPTGSVEVGHTLQLTVYRAFSPTAAKNAVAFNSDIRWHSSDMSKATVTNTGLVSGVSAGSVTIIAISGPFHGVTRLTVTPSALASIAVTSLNPSEPKGLSQQFTATGTYADTSTADITSSVNWSSANISIATISSTGVAKGKNVGGPITITAQDPSTGVTGTGQFTVTPAVLVSIVVTPANPLVPKGASQQLTATGVYSDNSTQDLTANVSWSSSNSAVASIGLTGLVTGSTIGGPLTITAQDPTTMISGTVQLTVGPPVVVSIAVAPGSATIVQSANQQFTATGTFTDASTANITNSVNWTSTSNAVARIGLNTGLATGMNGGGPATITATDPTTGISGTAQLTVLYAVVTYHNDMSRTGQDISETMLTPLTVNKTHFGRQFSQTVDGYIYAQPLYMPNVNIAGLGVHNVVYVATEHDSVYAFDADSNTGANANPLWKVSLIPAGGTTVSSGNDAGCSDLVPEIGITSTPVIDANSGTIYVVSKTKESGKFFQRLHALDITSGAEKFGGPVMIQASVKGTGDGSSGGIVTFNALKEHNRTSLLLQNGLVYIGWASHCDNGPYHGWLMAYNPTTLAQVAVFNTSPNSGLSGIWMGGAGLAGDGTNVFFATGNGTFDVNAGGKDYGDSIMSVGPPTAGTPPTTFPVLSYFTPFNQSSLNGGDVDVGSGGVLLLPTQTGQHAHLLVQVGKEGAVTLVDRDNMGGYCASCTTRDTQIVQELRGAVGGTWGMPAFWNNNVYFGGSGDRVKAYSFNAGGSGLLSANPTSRSTVGIGSYGPTPSVSANGNSNGIVWVIQADAYNGPGPAILRAFDATNLATELYNSTQNAGDSPGGAVKFTVPTVANGKVYVGTSSQLSVFALH